MLVFVSSTSEDLHAYRGAIRDVVLSLGWQPSMMEYFGTRSGSTVGECLAEVARCQLFILLVAFRRGFVPSIEQGGDGKRSITALELEQAELLQLPVLTFLADDTWPVGLIETNDGALSWIRDFRNGLAKIATFFPFESASSTAGDVPVFRSVVRQALLDFRERASPTPTRLLGGNPQSASPESGPAHIALRAPQRFRPHPPFPYPVLEPYYDPATFAGRDRELEEVKRQLALPRLLLCLHAPSGAGKSSFLRAGLYPRLSDDGYRVALDRVPDEPGIAKRLALELATGAPIETLSDKNVTQFADVLEEICLASGRPPVLIVDQLEDAVRRNEGRALQWLGPLLAVTARRVFHSGGFACRWVLAYRQEYHGVISGWLADVLRYSRSAAPGAIQQGPLSDLPYDLLRQDRYQSWALPLFGEPGPSAEPERTALDLFTAAIEQPLSIRDSVGKKYYRWQFEKGHAGRLAKTFASERLRLPRAPLVPELQVVLAYLLEHSRVDVDQDTIVVPENTADLIQGALSKHVRRKLEEAFVAEQPEQRQRRLRTQALFALRKLADAQGQRNTGIPTAELVTALGVDGSLVLSRLESREVSLVLQDSIEGQVRYVLPHDDVARVVNDIFSSSSERQRYDIDEELIELRELIDKRTELFRIGDDGSLALDSRVIARLRAAENSLIWDEESKTWWAAYRQKWETYTRARRRMRRAVAFGSLALLALVGYVLGPLRWQLVAETRLEETARTGEPSDAAVALSQLRSVYRYSGSALIDLVAARPDLGQVLGSGWIGNEKLRDSTAVFPVVEAAFPRFLKDSTIIGALLALLDSTPHSDRRYQQVRDRLLTQLRRARGSPPIQTEDWKSIINSHPGSTADFQMGCNIDSEKAEWCHDNERRHQVSLSPYEMLAHEVTFAEYRSFDPGHIQSFHPAPDVPAAEVNWYEAYAYAAWIGGSLPSEAQWEYAARAGTRTAWFTGNDPGQLSDYAWFNEPSKDNAHPVRGRAANQLGLYDMAGNVQEWCSDWYGNYPETAEINPLGPRSGSSRVARGGHFWSDARGVRSAARGSYLPLDRFNYLGFRVVRPQ
jgi:hypothetical protein